MGFLEKMFMAMEPVRLVADSTRLVQARNFESEKTERSKFKGKVFCDFLLFIVMDRDFAVNIQIGPL